MARQNIAKQEIQGEIQVRKESAKGETSECLVQQDKPENR